MQREHTATLSRTKQTLASYPTEFLECRDLGHNWVPSHVMMIKRPVSYETHVICDRCQSRRVRLLDRFGDVISSHLYYPIREDGRSYLLPSTTADLRGRKHLVRIEALLRDGRYRKVEEHDDLS